MGYKDLTKWKTLWNKGLTKETSESVKRISDALKGRKLSEEHKRTLSIALIKWNKDHPPTTGMKGKHHSEETKEKMRKAHIGLYHTKESNRINSEKHKGKKHSEETRCKQRLARIKRLERCVFNGGQVTPGYNPTACKFFDWFDNQYHTTGQYATKGGEHLIKELGYFVDYINHDLGIIIEWDEEYHYRGDMLRDKDIQRQETIVQCLPDYDLLRVRESCFDTSQL